MFAERIYELYARWEQAQETGSLFALEDQASPEEVDDVWRLIQELQFKASSTESSESACPRVGKMFAGFRLSGILGEGGFGTVFRAEDMRLHRKIAIKVLHKRALSRPNAKEKFLAEARALAVVQHDNVVPVFQVGEENGQLYLAMPLLGGETLAGRIEREGALPAADLARIGCETASGLAAIHARGLIHRDVKPANIWLESGSGRVKLLDLGLAWDPLSPGPTSAGTPSYMSPEQAAGDELDFRSDLFSLGTVLYECASGRRPFKRESALETLRSIREETPPPLARVNPGVSADVSAIVERLLRKDPRERPASAVEVVDEFRRLSTQAQETNHQRTARTGSNGWLRFAKAAIVLGLVVLLAAGACVVSLGLWDRGAPENASPTDSQQTSPSALRIASFKISHCGLRNGEPLKFGAIGDFRWRTRESDELKVEAEFNRPGYCYLVAFNPDGNPQLCHPDNDRLVPLPVDSIHYPAGQNMYFPLTDGTGVQVFVLVASREPLPSWREWNGRHGLAPWSKVVDDAVWEFDGSDWQFKGTERGPPRESEVFKLPKPLNELSAYFVRGAPTARVRSWAFPVREREGAAK